MTAVARWEQYAPGPVRQIHVDTSTAAAAPDKGENRGRGRGRGGKGTGRGRGRGRASKKSDDCTEEPPSELKDVPPPAPKSKPTHPKKPRVGGATNGTEGPGHFEGKIATSQPVIPPGVLSGAQIDALMSDGPTAQGLPDDDDPPQNGSTVSLGCPRCYFSKWGCSTCKRPGYKPRGPNIRTTGPKAKAKSKAVHKDSLKLKVTAAKAKAKAKSAAKFPKVTGRGRGRGPAKARC